jgi:hypothetical protein
LLLADAGRLVLVLVMVVGAVVVVVVVVVVVLPPPPLLLLVKVVVWEGGGGVGLDLNRWAAECAKSHKGASAHICMYTHTYTLYI